MDKYINKICYGDNLEVLKEFAPESINLHINSPPYADMKVYENSKGMHPDKYVEWIIPRIKQIERTLKENGSFLLNINDKVISKFRHPYVFELIVEIHKQTNLKLFERLFWNKGKYLPHPKRFGDKIEYLFLFVKSPDFYIDMDSLRVEYDPKSIKRMQKPIKKRFNRNKENQDAGEYKNWKENPLGALPSTLITIGSESQRKSNNHTAVFPEKLPSYFIKGLTRPNDIICDIFNGTGTSLIAANKLGRRFIGVDCSYIYCQESQDRFFKEFNQEIEIVRL